MNHNINHIELPIDSIILLDENPRDINESELNKLAEEIKEDPTFLIQRPPLVNFTKGKYLCYAGTQRIRASKINGAKTIICFVEENVSKRVQDKRMVIDNLHRGQWNEEKLLKLDFELSELQDLGFKDFEVSIFTELEQPTDLTAPMKEAPPTMKITFVDTKQMDRFKDALPIWLSENHFDNVTFSVSQGEI